MVIVKIVFFNVSIVCFLVSCSNEAQNKTISLPGFSIECPENWDLDTTNHSQPIDTDFGMIITENKDTIRYEYGKGINRLLEPLKTVVPVSQKKYWDSVGLSSEVILSNTPQDDIDLSIHSKEYYLKDTIQGIEVIWVFPKRFREGRTGAYFRNPKGGDLSIYSNELSEGEVNAFISSVRSIRFDTK